jgi:microcin C transport system substrate-binding protein
MINARQLTRRETLLLGTAALASSLAQNVEATQIEAAQETERHGLSAFGDLKYPADFKHFDYVNPTAPKGGVFSHIGATRAFNQNFLTFNSLNTFILKGDGAQGMELTFASLIGTRRG